MKKTRTGNFSRVQVYNTRNRKRSFSKIVLFFFIIALLMFTTSLLTIIFYQKDNHMTSYKQMAVVPGAGITKSGDPSIALKYRLDKAYELYGDGMVSEIYISGKKDEVRIMKKYLIEFYSIPESDIIEDGDGDNTYHTVKNTKEYIESQSVDGVVFISQKFHTPRIQLLVNRQNFTNAVVVATDKKNVELENYFSFLIRESLALIKAFIFSK